MYPSYGPQMARQHQAQLMHDAEVFRLTKETRAAKVAERRTAFHRVVVSALSLVAWPIKH